MGNNKLEVIIIKAKKSDKAHKEQNSTVNAGAMPDTAFDLVNRYGTYEIQATADSGNIYPLIAQGFNPKQLGDEIPLSNPTKKEEKEKKL